MRSPSWSSARTSPDAVTPRLSVDSGAGRIALAGELDRQTAHRLLDAVRTMAASEQRDWVLDTHDLHFCDASGLRAIAVTYRQAVRHGATLTVVGAGGSLRRGLAAIKLDHHVLGARYPLAKVYVL